MPRSAGRGSLGESIQHLSHIRWRISGSGVIHHTVFSLDDTKSKAIPILTMTPLPGIEPTKLANFVSQRIALEGVTTDINAYFKINRIIIFLKEYGSGEYPSIPS